MKKEKNERIKEMYIKGYSASKITKIINREFGLEIKLGAITKYIQRNLKDCKAEHNKNKAIIRDCRRVVSNSSRSYMGTKQLIMWNRQSYKADSAGNLRYDSTRGKAPADLPKRYSVSI